MDHRSRKYIATNRKPQLNKVDLPRQPRQVPQLRGRRTLEPRMHQLRQQAAPPGPPEPLQGRRGNREAPGQPGEGQGGAGGHRHRPQPGGGAQRQARRLHALEGEAPGEGRARRDSRRGIHRALQPVHGQDRGAHTDVHRHR